MKRYDLSATNNRWVIYILILDHLITNLKTRVNEKHNSAFSLNTLIPILMKDGGENINDNLTVTFTEF